VALFDEMTPGAMPSKVSGVLMCTGGLNAALQI